MEFPNQQPLWDWINERHAIYLRRKEGKPWPWTDDPILREYRFCNVFRELDTVTQWLDQNWRKPYASHPNLWFMMAMARLINWPGTLSQITDTTAFPDEFIPEEFLDTFRWRRGKGLKIFGGAYVITNGGSTLPKEQYILQESLVPLWNRRAEFQQSMTDTLMGIGPVPTIENVWTWLRKTNGFGPFIAYEVVTDLRHTRYLQNAPDIMTWANAGPGALRGLNRLAGRPLDAPLRAKDALAGMRWLLATANSPNGLVKPHVPLPLEMRDIEHSLCETDKYLRVKNGEGRPRAKYDPSKATTIA